WFNRGPSDFEIAMNLFRDDHYPANGEGPLEANEIQKIQKFYSSDRASRKVEMGEYADSYFSGTGVTALSFFRTADEKTLIVIPKFVYAE
ncbi:MAG: hypothetical protein AAF203_06860, partial [Pseudomonadota bacterium]